MAPLNVLMVGSCLMENFALNFRGFGHTVDQVVFNNVAELPLQTPEALAAYDLQIVQIPIRNLLPDRVYLKLKFDDLAGHQAFYDHACAVLEPMIAAALRYNEQSGLLTFVSNFLVPQQNPMGRLLPRYDIRNPVYFTEQLNRRLSELVASYSNVHLLDVDQISANVGRMYHQDDHVWAVSHGGVMLEFDHPLDQNRIHPATAMAQIYQLRPTEFMHAVCNEIEAMYRSIRQVDPVKLVVVDLDDTLWRGVVAEEGRFGEIEGWPLGFLEALAFLKARGVLLAIASKNDGARIEALWDDYFQGRLDLDDFVARKINWRPKTDNMAELLEETNLLPRNVVFVDDNPVERAAMAAAYPDIRTLGAEPYLLRRILLWSAETQPSVITAESVRRTEMIQAQAERRVDAKRLSRADFLASLGLRIHPFRITRQDDPRFARAFELLNKTNQFNTTGQRWTAAEMTALFADKGVLHAFEVEDRYSSYGLTGVAVTRGATIEQFVMSCRVVGMEVEISMLAEVCRALRTGGRGAVTALARETDANLLSRDFFARAGFQAHDDQWLLSLESEIAAPVYAELTR